MTWMTGGELGGFRRFSRKKLVFLSVKERNNGGFVNVSFKEENSWG